MPQVDFEENVIRALISYKGKNGAVLKRDAVMTMRLRETLLNLQQKKPVKAFRRLRNGDKPSERLVFVLHITYAEVGTALAKEVVSHMYAFMICDIQRALGYQRYCRWSM